MTQLQAARQGITTPKMVRVAQRECVTPELIRDEVARRRLPIHASAVIAPMLLIFLAASAAVWGGQTEAQTGPGKKPQLRPGQRAPALSIDKLLQAPDSAVATWPALKGKCVVLEFWATWCAPCVTAIPHLNELSGQFKNRPVVFISVTDENEPKIKRFLKKRAIDAWIGLDSDCSLFEDYQVKGIPHTVLVDAKGIIAGITSPESVTAETIEDLLAGRPLKVKARDDEGGLVAGADPLEHGKAPAPLYQILIRPSDPSTIYGQSSRGGGRMSIVGLGAIAILAQAFDVAPFLIDANGNLPDGMFDVIAIMPRGSEALLHPSLQRALEVAFDISVRREMRETDVLVLASPPGSKHKLTPTVMLEDDRSSMSSSDKDFEMMGQPVDVFADALARRLNRPVVNETGLPGRFDMKLKWDDSGSESIMASVHATLGLEIREAKRRIEFLVVDNAKESVAKQEHATGGAK